METRFLSLYGTYHIAKNGVLQVTRIEALQIAKIGAVQVTNYRLDMKHKKHEHIDSICKSYTTSVTTF